MIKSKLLLSLAAAAAAAAAMASAQSCVLTSAPPNNGTLIYSNALDAPASLTGWVAEGRVVSNFTAGALELSSATATDGDFVYWLPDAFPARLRVTWDFSPQAEPGLAMFFFGAAAAATGGSIFDPGLAPRNGSYAQYHSGDIRTLHASYFRRRWPAERAFHLANLRKSPGFHLVAQGADPLPSVVDAPAGAWYAVEVVKDGPAVYFSINGLPVFSWRDDGSNSTGPVVGAGRIGLRQMAPLVARYRNLQVFAL